MKKVLSIAILFVMVAMLATTTVNAATNADLASKLYAIGAKYGMTSADKVKIERYLADNPVTDAEANQVVAKAQQTANVMEAEGVTNVKDLTAEKKEEVKTLLNQAANVVGVNLTFKSGAVEVYKDGKLVETLGTSNGKLAYTGNNVNVILVVSSVAVVALVAGFVARKKFANA